MAAAKAMLLEILTPAAYRHLDDLRERAWSSGATTRSAATASPGYVSALGAKGASCSRPCRIRNYRDFFGYDARSGHAHWLYQHNGGVFLPPWGKMRAVDAVGPAHRRRRRPVPSTNLERFAPGPATVTTR